MQSDGKAIFRSATLITINSISATLEIFTSHIPVLRARVSEVRHKNLHRFDIARHEHRILVFLHHEFQSPQSVRNRSKSTTDCWPLTITDESEVFWEEEIVDLFGRISLCPQRKAWMGFGCWGGYFQIHGNPCFVVSKSDKISLIPQDVFSGADSDICSINTPLGSRYVFLVNPVFPSQPTKNFERIIFCVPTASEYWQYTQSLPSSIFVTVQEDRS